MNKFAKQQQKILNFEISMFIKTLNFRFNSMFYFDKQSLNKLESLWQTGFNMGLENTVQLFFTKDANK